MLPFLQRRGGALQARLQSIESSYQIASFWIGGMAPRCELSISTPSNEHRIRRVIRNVQSCTGANYARMRQHLLPSLGVPTAHCTALFADENNRLRRRERKSVAGVSRFKAPQKFSILRLQRNCPIISSGTFMSKQVCVRTKP
jgi:hypothetical protein